MTFPGTTTFPGATTFTGGDVGPGSPVGGPTPIPVTDLPVAGELYRLRYFPTLNRQSVDVTSVDLIELFATPQRAGVPALTVVGPAERVALGEYAFPATVMPAAAVYHAVVTFRTGATVREDDNDPVVVHAYSGTVGSVGPAPGVLVDVASFRAVDLRGNSFESDHRLREFLDAAQEVVESYVGPIRPETVVQARWREACRIIAVHLAERHAAAVPEGGLQQGTDETGVFGRGFSIPAAARELLEPARGRVVGPVGSFPEPERYPEQTGPYGYGYGYGQRGAGGGW